MDLIKQIPLDAVSCYIAGSGNYTKFAGIYKDTDNARILVIRVCIDQLEKPQQYEIAFNVARLGSQENIAWLAQVLVNALIDNLYKCRYLCKEELRTKYQAFLDMFL